MAQPFVPAPNVVQLEAIYTSNGQHCENVYHFHLAAPPDISKLQNLAGELIAWETSIARAHRNDSSGLLKVVARDMSSQSAPSIEAAPAQFNGGQNVSGSMPNNVTIAIKHVTALSGRSFRGRSYWIGLCRDQCTSNTISAAALAAVKSDMGTLLTNMKTNQQADMVCVSKRFNKAWRTTAVSTPIVTFTVDNNLDSQRRRLTGRGT